MNLKKLNIIFILLICGKMNPLFCQTDNMTEFIGTLQLTDNKLITYKIAFSEEHDGIINGVSTTDFYGENSTQAKISGFYNHKEHLISFKELVNINTKSTAADSEFCFIQIDNARLKSIKGKTIIQGVFNGFYHSKTICATGNIYLISQNFVEELSNKFEKKALRSKDSTLLNAQIKLKDLMASAKQVVLKSNNTFNIKWKSNEIILAVWDAEKLDQDKINIFADGKLILENFIIKKDKKIIVIPFDSKSCKIKILALNEGEIPPNTVNAELLDGTEVTPFISSLNKGESTTIRIEKE